MEYRKLYDERTPITVHGILDIMEHIKLDNTKPNIFDVYQIYKLDGLDDMAFQFLDGAGQLYTMFVPWHTALYHRVINAKRDYQNDETLSNRRTRVSIFFNGCGWDLAFIKGGKNHG